MLEYDALLTRSAHSMAIIFAETNLKSNIARQPTGNLVPRDHQLLHHNIAAICVCCFVTGIVAAIQLFINHKIRCAPATMRLHHIKPIRIARVSSKTARQILGRIKYINSPINRLHYSWFFYGIVFVCKCWSAATWALQTTEGNRPIYQHAQNYDRKSLSFGALFTG